MKCYYSRITRREDPEMTRHKLFILFLLTLLIAHFIYFQVIRPGGLLSS